MKKYILDYSRFILKETIINLFDKNEKSEYADEVWELITNAYDKLGGIKGSGFTSKNDMIENIHMWKLSKYHGKITSAILYKDKKGRKIVATATDKSEHGIKSLKNNIVNDIVNSKSYVEISANLLSFIYKNIPNLRDYAFNIKDVETILGDDIFDVEDDDIEAIKYPTLKPFLYKRYIGDSLITKIMVGNNSKFY